MGLEHKRTDTGLASTTEKAEFQRDRMSPAMTWWLETTCFHDFEILNRTEVAAEDEAAKRSIM